MKKTILQFMVFLVGMFVCTFYTNEACAEQINLPQDNEGWTIFTPSSDSHIVYVSADGNDTAGQVYSNVDFADPFNPSEEVAFATYAAAYAHTRDGYPDWILIRRGDTFVEAINSNVRSGRDANEPFLIGAYGNYGLSPVFKTGSSSGIAAINRAGYIAVSGISFYAHTRDPVSIDFVDTTGGKGFAFQVSLANVMQGILIEGCKFAFFSNNEAGPFTGSDDATLDGFTLRRSVITYTYASINGGHTQGLRSYHGHNMVFEDNVIDHNGWYDPHGGVIGQAEALSHNIYFSSVQNVTFKNNIISRGSSAGTKFTSQVDSSGVELINNLYVDNQIDVSFDPNKEENLGRSHGTVINNNVFALTGLTRPTGGTASWGMWLKGVLSAGIQENLFISDTVAVDNAHSIIFGGKNANINVIGNIGLVQENAQDVINFSVGTTSSNITISGNKFETSGDTSNFINGADQVLSELTLSGNNWYNASGGQFGIDSAIYNEVQWISAVEPTASFAQPSYTDRTRNVQTYLASIGETATLDSFYTLIKAQDRYDWDSRLTAPVINNWIRAGFAIGLSRADVDNSSAITTTDALLTLRNSLGLSMAGTAWQTSSTTGDVNCDGNSNSTDALLILRHSLGLSMSETSWCE